MTTETSASRDFEIARSHFQRIWATRHAQTGTSTLHHRPGDTTDRYEMARESLRLLVSSMRATRLRHRKETVCGTCGLEAPRGCNNYQLAAECDGRPW